MWDPTGFLSAREQFIFNSGNWGDSGEDDGENTWTSIKKWAKNFFLGEDKVEKSVKPKDMDQGVWDAYNLPKEYANKIGEGGIEAAVEISKSVGEVALTADALFSAGAFIHFADFDAHLC